MTDRLTPFQRAHLAAQNYAHERSRDRWLFACAIVAFLIVVLLAFEAGCKFRDWQHRKAHTEQWVKETIAK